MAMVDSVLSKNSINTSKNNENEYLNVKGNLIDYKDNNITTYFDNFKEYSADSILEKREDKEKKAKQIDFLKRKILNMLINENIVVGYTSMTEVFLDKCIEDDLSLTKDILNMIYVACYDNPENLQKFIEVMSNLNYQKLYPTNTILALGVINHVDIGVQEAAIAAFEKWDDGRNVAILKSTKYTVEWIEDYANEVIDYLESC
jgi:hypothetical protein